MNWDVFKEVNKNFNENTKNINDCITIAYSISITEWNIMSEKCINFVKNKYLLKETNIENINSFDIISSEIM